MDEIKTKKYPDYYSMGFNSVSIDNTANSNNVSSTIKAMEDNYQRSITTDTSLVVEKQETKPNTKSIDMNQLASLLNGKNDNANLVNLLLENMGSGMSSDKVKLISELIKMIGKNNTQLSENKPRINSEINSSDFVRTSDYTLE